MDQQPIFHIQNMVMVFPLHILQTFKYGLKYNYFYSDVKLVYLKNYPKIINIDVNIDDTILHILNTL